jgi:hypothetical protein
MVIKGKVAPRPIVNNNDEASSAAVERLSDGFIISARQLLMIFLLCLIRITMP